MDPLEAAHAMLATIQAKGDLSAHVTPDVHFRSDRHDILDADAVQALMQERLQGMAAQFDPGDVVMKRNLVFAWFTFENVDGKPVARGTWILSFDRDGRVVEWQEFAG